MSERQYNLVITEPARSDLAAIGKYTQQNYGSGGLQAYNALMMQALRDITEDPFRPGSRARPEISEHSRSYHIGLSKTRAQSEVKSPRHFVLYYVHDNDDLLVKGVLHESRDIERRISERDRQYHFPTDRPGPSRKR